MSESIEVRPSLKAAVFPLLSVLLSGIIASALPLYLSNYFGYHYAVDPLLGLLLLILGRERAYFEALPFFFGGLSYFNKYLSLTALLVALLEMAFIVRLYRSTRVIVSSNDIVVERDYIIKSVIKNIPKSSIAEISVSQGILEKLLGYSDLVIVLRNGNKIKVEGVKKDLAERVLETVRSK